MRACTAALGRSRRRPICGVCPCATGRAGVSASAILEGTINTRSFSSSSRGRGRRAFVSTTRVCRGEKATDAAVRGRVSALATSCVGCFGAVSAWAASPNAGGLRPNGCYRGTRTLVSGRFCAARGIYSASTEAGTRTSTASIFPLTAPSRRRPAQPTTRAAAKGQAAT